jgi:methylglutaconyl-CoA hydratase
LCAKTDSEEVRLNYLTDAQKGIAVIELNREIGKNSFNRSMTAKLHHCIDTLTTDKSVRVVIIRSLVKGVFCAGADLKERRTLTPVEVHRFVNSLRSMGVRMENLPMPTISGEKMCSVVVGGD